MLLLLYHSSYSSSPVSIDDCSCTCFFLALLTNALTGLPFCLSIETPTLIPKLAACSCLVDLTPLLFLFAVTGRDRLTFFNFYGSSHTTGVSSFFSTFGSGLLMSFFSVALVAPLECVTGWVEIDSCCHAGTLTFTGETTFAFSCLAT